MLPTADAVAEKTTSNREPERVIALWREALPWSKVEGYLAPGRLEPSKSDFKDIDHLEDNCPIA